MSSVKILIVEDEVLIADHLMDTLEDLGYEVDEPALTYTDALQRIEAGIPDLAILDIQLSGRKTGIDLGRLINEQYHFPFIFLTSNSDRTTLEAAKSVSPAAFLVKPYTQEDLFASIEIALSNFEKSKHASVLPDAKTIRDSLFVKHNKTFHRVYFKDILYIESAHIYLEVYLTSGKKYTIRSSFSELLERLEGDFERIHRSYVVNLAHLQGIGQGSVTIGDQEIPLSKAHRDKIMKRIEKL